MSDYADRMADYVPVNERIDTFKASFPDGSLQSEIVELTESRVTVKAYAYRTPEDARPGIGHSSLEIPGRTPYTKGSEIENAETSAWGRAIAALGFEVKRGISSAEEVRNKPRNDEPGDGERSEAQRVATSSATTRRRASGTARRETAAPSPDNYRRDELLELAQAKGLDRDALERYAAMVGVPNGQRANHEQMDQLIEVIQQHRNELPDGEQEASGPSEASVSSADPTPDSPPAEPPRPDTDEYRALPSGTERAAARAYWEQRKDGEQVSLAAALGAPESDR